MHTPPLNTENSEAPVKEPGIGVLVISESNSIVIALKGSEKLSTKIPFGTKPLYDALKLKLNASNFEVRELVKHSGSVLDEIHFEPEKDLTDESREQCLKKLTAYLWQKEIKTLIVKYLEDIITYAYYAIRNAGFERKIDNGLIITGELSELPGLKTLAERVTGLECEICNGVISWRSKISGFGKGNFD